MQKDRKIYVKTLRILRRGSQSKLRSSSLGPGTEDIKL